MKKWRLFEKIRQLLPIRYTAQKCGHRTKKKGAISAFGHKGAVDMPFNDSGGIDYCLDCIGKMAICCAWCSEVIWIGQPITLYPPARDFELPEHAVKYSDNPVRFVGCLSWNCADTGADRAGFWLPGEDGTGAVLRVMSGVEEVLLTHSISIVENLADIPAALERQKKLAQK